MPKWPEYNKHHTHTHTHIPQMSEAKRLGILSSRLVSKFTHMLCCYLVAQFFVTLCDPLDCRPPDSSLHGIFEARVLEWVANSFSRGSFWPRDRIRISYVSRIAGRFFTHWALEEVWFSHVTLQKPGNRTAIWPSNPTSGHTHWGNQIWKRHVHPNVHSSTVYNCQDVEAT